ncbi:hypothetical protein YC2023_095234 [Brassica napus]|uniref:(rape) hypothetical protein n=1 Tax=Brassica napus TaxID=3708 RepID=A0A817ABW6_BRANA|nr:unnamed protein product [Brassica napus]
MTDLLKFLQEILFREGIVVNYTRNSIISGRRLLQPPLLSVRRKMQPLNQDCLVDSVICILITILLSLWTCGKKEDNSALPEDLFRVEARNCSENPHMIKQITAQAKHKD